MMILIQKLMCWVFISGVLMYWQADYTLIFERMEVIWYNKLYLSYVHIKTFKINRTQAAVNFTFHVNKRLGYDLKVQVQGYRFASNEYRLFPIRFMFDVCQTLKNNDWGIQNIYNCGNFPRCPIGMGNFTVCNWGPDYSRFPPYLPGGRYKAEISFFYKTVEFAMFNCYTEVKPKERWEMKL